MTAPRTACFGLAACAAARAACAQPLADPTRPPSAAALAAGAGEPAGPQLQSVVISSGRKLAVIDGETVPLGGKFRDATLVRVSETEVVLKSGERTETLKLYPGVDKQPVRRRAAPARRGAP